VDYLIFFHYLLLTQNYGSGKIPVIYYVFDLMVLDGVDVMREPLSSVAAEVDGS
jgi:hypothetical protein